MAPTPLAAILFDMDGVLCDSESLIADAAVVLFARYGKKVSPEDFRPFIGTGEAKYLGGVAQLVGLTLDLEKAKGELYVEYFKMAKGHLKAVPGALDFQTAATQRGLYTALATSADRSKLTVNLDAIGLNPGVFGALISGDLITHKKPDPEIFLTAAKALGVPPASCLVVEDALNGVQAALAAGCRCLALSTTFPKETLLAAGAHHVLPDLRGAMDFLESWWPAQAKPASEAG